MKNSPVISLADLQSKIEEMQEDNCYAVEIDMDNSIYNGELHLFGYQRGGDKTDYGEIEILGSDNTDDLDDY